MRRNLWRKNCFHIQSGVGLQMPYNHHHLSLSHRLSHIIREKERCKEAVFRRVHNYGLAFVVKNEQKNKNSTKKRLET